MDIVFQENLDTWEGEDKIEEGRDGNGKRLRIEEGEISEQEEKEQQEAKKIRIDKGEISDEGLSRAVRSSSSSSLSSVELDAEVEAVLSPPKKKDIVIGNDNDNARFAPVSRQLPRRIDTGVFSQIPPELLFHILKFLSSEV